MSPDTWPAERLVEVAQSLVDLADTQADDFDVTQVSVTLLRDCSQVVPSRASGVLLLDADGTLDLLAQRADPEVAEVLEADRAAGPGATVVQTGEAIWYDGLDSLAERWPDFVEAARKAGISTGCAVPLRLREETIGALVQLGATTSELTENDRLLVRALADSATIGIVHQRSLAQAALVSEQLQHALDSRVVVEQAKGIVAEYGGFDVGTAFNAIRSYARSHREPLVGVAARLAAGNLAPGEVTPAGDRRRSATPIDTPQRSRKVTRSSTNDRSDQ